MMYRFVLVLSLVSPLANADCALEQNWCEATCKVRFVTNDAEQAGCISRCVAERAVCSAKVGADKATDIGKEVLEDSKSFINGLTSDSVKEMGENAWDKTKDFLNGMKKESN